LAVHELYAFFTSSCSISWGDGQKTAILFPVKTLYLNGTRLSSASVRSICDFGHDGHLIAADNEVLNNYGVALPKVREFAETLSGFM
jgi:hypothetical protein